MVSRRAILGSAAALVAIAAIPLSSGIRAWIHAQLADEFGTEIADQATEQGFVEDYVTSLKEMRYRDYILASVYFRVKPHSLVLMKGSEEEMRGHLMNLFLRSSNAVLAVEKGGPFEYTGLFFPEVNPCSNQLSSLASPD